MNEPRKRQPIADRETVERNLDLLDAASRDDLDELLTDMLCVTHPSRPAQDN